MSETFISEITPRMDRHQASVTEVNAYLNDLVLRDRGSYHLISHENLNQRELYVDAKHLSKKRGTRELVRNLKNKVESVLPYMNERVIKAKTVNIYKHKERNHIDSRNTTDSYYKPTENNREYKPEDIYSKPTENRTVNSGLPMSYASALSKQNTGISHPSNQMMQNTGYSQRSNQMMQNTGISQPSNQMMQNHVMQDFINQVKLMNNSMQALTNLFSRNAAMMNPLEQGFFT